MFAARRLDRPKSGPGIAAARFDCARECADVMSHCPPGGIGGDTSALRGSAGRACRVGGGRLQIPRALGEIIGRGSRVGSRCPKVAGLGREIAAVKACSPRMERVCVERGESRIGALRPRARGSLRPRSTPPDAASASAGSRCQQPAFGRPARALRARVSAAAAFSTPTVGTREQFLLVRESRVLKVATVRLDSSSARRSPSCATRVRVTSPAVWRQTPTKSRPESTAPQKSAETHRKSWAPRERVARHRSASGVRGRAGATRTREVHSVLVLTPCPDSYPPSDPAR